MEPESKNYGDFRISKDSIVDGMKDDMKKYQMSMIRHAKYFLPCSLIISWSLVTKGPFKKT